MEQAINGQTFTLSWKVHANDALGSASDADGEPEGFGELIGEGMVRSKFGPRKAGHYRAALDDGTVVDYYIGAESPVMYRTVTIDAEAGVMTIELSDTNIDGIKDANR